MPSPFPGMDPYLEKRSLWPGLHSRLIYNTSDVLQPLLRPKYVANIQEHIQLASDSYRSFIPDATIIEKPQIREPSVAYVTEELIADEPNVAMMLNTERRVPFIEIIEVTSGEVVTVIELLSPVNKSSGGREKYLQKQETLLKTEANLVEVDLLSYGRLTVLARRVEEIKPEDWRYIINVSRAANRDNLEYYAFTLKDRLPRPKIPLRAPDPDVPLDLPTAFGRSYDAGAYDLLVDYTQPPDDGVLNEDEQKWANELLATEN